MFVYFFLERICFEFMKSFFSIASEGGEGIDLAQLLSSKDEKRQIDNIQRLMEMAVRKTRTAWLGADTNADPETPNILFSTQLFSILYKIVIEKDMDPLSIITCSDALGGMVEKLDDILVKVLFYMNQQQ